ncbi:hypothetical protein MKX03_024685 [Papaver bracteatum]|nr:hypothetical protein MKX03_024685 [Papaver bracteatum]
MSWPWFLFPDSSASPKFVLSIRRRTEDDIKLASSVESVDQGTLCDPEDDALRIKRKMHPSGLLLLVSEPILVASLCLMAGDFGGLLCPCHGSHYVISGRIREVPVPKNREYLFTTFWRIRSFLCFLRF